MKPRLPLLSLLLLLLTLAVFSGALECGFANLDDPDYVTDNAFVRQGLTANSVAAAFRIPVLGNWHPLTMLSFQLDWQLFGPNPAGFHLTSLLLHAANAVLVLAVFRTLGVSTFTALFAAALFAWHPLRVESVVWIAERKDVLSGFFFLATLWFYLGFLHRGPAGAKRWIWYGAALATFALGLLSKPMLVTAPGVLLLLDFLRWSRRGPAPFTQGQPHSTGGACSHAIPGDSRVPANSHNGTPDAPHHDATAGPTDRSLSTLPWRAAVGRALGTKIPFVLLSLGIAIVTIATQQEAGATAQAGRSLGTRLATALATLPVYLGKTLWPSDLVPLYPLPATIPWTLVACGVVLLLSSLASCAWQWEKRPWLAVGWLWFLGMVLPVGGLFQAGGQFIADRYTYLPGLGLLLLLACALDEFKPRAPRRLKMMATVCGGTLLVLLTLLTVQQTTRWKDPITLWEYTLGRTTKNPIAHFSLGNAYIQEGRLAEAERELRSALTLAPRLQIARTNLGVVLASTGRPAEALEQFRLSVTLGTKNGRTQLNIARILLSLGRDSEAIAECRAILDRWPGQADAQAMLTEAIERQSPKTPPPQLAPSP